VAVEGGDNAVALSPQGIDENSMSSWLRESTTTVTDEKAITGTAHPKRARTFGALTRVVVRMFKFGEKIL
jgi:hypothetical protein